MQDFTVHLHKVKPERMT